MRALSYSRLVLVPFSGAGCGDDELSWGQREMWGAMRRQRSSLPMGAVQRLPAGTTVDDVVATLRFVMGRHQSLRTRLRFDADEAAGANRANGAAGIDGAAARAARAHRRPRQVVSTSGEVPLEIVDAGDADPDTVAAEVDRRYQATEFDYEHEWPVRMAVVLAGGVPSHMVARYCHLAADGEGMAVLIADLANLDRATGEATRPLTGREPLEQVRWQRGPAGQRQSQATLRHWEALLRTVPPRRFGASPDPRTPRHWELGYRSPAAHLAAAVVADRTGTDTTPVLLAAFAVLLGRLTAIHPVVTQVIVNNRFRPGLGGTVTTVNHPGLCVIEVAGLAFDEVVARAWRATISAYKHAYYDPDQRDELIARVGRERGAELDLSCYFNDRRSRTRAERVPAADEILAARPLSTLHWEPPRDVPVERLFLHVNDVPDAVDLTVVADTHHVSPGQMEWLARELEALLVEVATP